jgi:hypothetical protein
VVLVLTVSLPAGAQDGSETIEVGTFEVPAPLMEVADVLAEPPPLSEEQLANQQWAAENTPGMLPVIEGEQSEPAGPVPETESIETDVRIEPGAPLAPGTATTYRWKQFGASIPSGQSNVLESSIDGKGKRLFYSGNWFAARSTDKGLNWNYLSPYSGMPDFCCDQVVRHDISRNIFLWLRMGVPDSNGENRFALSVSFREPFTAAYWTYFIKPEDINSSWQNVWWDYPAMSMTADYLFITWNLYTAVGSYSQTVVLKVNLDNLAAAGSFAGSYYNTTSWASIKPIDGADHTMYMASTWPNSLPQNSRIGIWRWKDADGSLVFWDKTLPAWTFSNRNDSHCGSPNWLARSDQRTLAGARYNIDTSDFQNPGRNVVAWWWNVAEGGNFSLPYIEGAAFYEDTMTLVSGTDGRPYVYNPDICFAYPDTATNRREDVGLVFNWADSPGWHKPKAAFALADDYTSSPPGWVFYGAVGSQAGPSDQKWGDYNTVRGFAYRSVWIAGVHYIPGTSNCSDCSVPLFFSFGRERDANEFWY